MDVPELSSWLRRNLSTLRQLEHAGQAYDELCNTIGRARAYIDYPNTRTRFEVGPCPEALDRGFCDGTVWAFIASSDDKLSFMRCEECEMKWDSTQWLRVGPRIYRRRNQLKSAS